MAGKKLIKWLKKLLSANVSTILFLNKIVISYAFNRQNLV